MNSSGWILVAIAGCMVLAAGCAYYPGGPATPPPTTPVPTATVSPVETTPAVTAIPSGTSPVPGPIRYVPGGTYHVGDEILISGSTILSGGNQLLIEVTSVSFGPAPKENNTAFSGASAVVTVEEGVPPGNNSWSYILDTAGFVPDEYVVTITALTVRNLSETSTFTLLP
ncbi:hypothetical protein J2741_001295 [Methanolinea mesophila]|uniref:hypothetical protein n=1 Tax=Methanolinea mesophila TaxID=547055 RepID=UPI001AE3A16B|nr:hypothetical protein [Methanolinea mesophila]MBP1928748.1 hypothetical protein [Methanolinea mesophila]